MGHARNHYLDFGGNPIT